MSHRYSYHVNLDNLNTTAGFVYSQLKPGDRVLDLGAGPGLLSRSLRERGHHVTAVDQESEALLLLRDNADRIFELDLEQDSLDPVFQDGYYDVVLLCDVLEHLVDPAAFLEKLGGFHARFGTVLVTLPNVSYGGVVGSLLQDHFEYADAGILDRTHLRFFTQNSFTALIETVGFRTKSYHPICLPLPTQEFPLAGEILELIRSRGDAHFETYQHCFALEWLGAPRRHGPYEQDLLTVVIRTIDGRLGFLDTTLFSLLGQDYAPYEVVVVYQGTSDLYHGELEQLLNHYRNDGMRLTLLQNPTQEDQRARNINLGLQAARGQFVAFLDDDDVVYPEHYAELIQLIRDQGVAWAYSDVHQANCKRDAHGNLYIFAVHAPFKRDGYNFAEHWLGNFIPIHSFVVDRNAVDAGTVMFDERFDRNEDYAFLLKLASRHKPGVLGKFTCAYRIRFDGTNSVTAGTLDTETRNQKEMYWERSRIMLEVVKRELKAGQWLPQILDALQRNHIELGRLQEENLRLKALFGLSPEATHFVKPPRYRLADQLNTMVKSVPIIHRTLRALGMRFSDTLKAVRERLRVR